MPCASSDDSLTPKRSPSWSSEKRLSGAVLLRELEGMEARLEGEQVAFSEKESL